MNKWETVNEKTYYFGEDGYALSGMKKVDGKYYWFNTKYHYMYRNHRVTRTNGDIYYFGSDGVRYAGGMTQVTEKGKVNTYYFHNGSKAVSGTRAENITLTSSKNIVSVFNAEGVCVKQYKKK